MRISRKNAARIRAGIKAGRWYVRANNAGLPLYGINFPQQPLSNKACHRVIARELDRLTYEIIDKMKRMP